MNCDNRPIEWNSLSAERICAISILENLGIPANNEKWYALEDAVTRELIALTDKYINYKKSVA